jgi:hypothetical protein
VSKRKPDFLDAVRSTRVKLAERGISFAPLLQADPAAELAALQDDLLHIAADAERIAGELGEDHRDWARARLAAWYARIAALHAGGREKGQR